MKDRKKELAMILWYNSIAKYDGFEELLVHGPLSVEFVFARTRIMVPSTQVHEGCSLHAKFDYPNNDFNIVVMNNDYRILYSERYASFEQAASALINKFDVTYLTTLSHFEYVVEHDLIDLNKLAGAADGFAVFRASGATDTSSALFSCRTNDNLYYVTLEIEAMNVEDEKLPNARVSLGVTVAYDDDVYGLVDLTSFNADVGILDKRSLNRAVDDIAETVQESIQEHSHKRANARGVGAMLEDIKLLKQ